MIRPVAILLCAAACAEAQHPDPGQALRIAALEQQVAGQQRQIDDLKAQVGVLPPQQQAEIAALRDELVELEHQTHEPAPPAARPATPSHRFGPQPDVVYAVRVGDSPVEGPANAKVTMVVTSDYACPYCERVMPTLDELRKRYGNDLRVVHKTFLVHKATSPIDATLAASAACAANKQHKWRQYDDLVWKEGFDKHSIDAALLDNVATRLKLDMTKFHGDLAGRCATEIQDENAAMQKLGVNAIPTTFINGKPLSGAMPIEQFVTAVDEAMARANEAIGRGVSASRYYEDEIVNKGADGAAP